MNKAYLFLFLFFGLLSCESDEPADMEDEMENEMEMEMETDECGGAIEIMVDGERKAFNSPLSATFAETGVGYELFIVWMTPNNSVSIQMVVDQPAMNCVPLGRQEVDSLATNTSVLYFSYQEGLSTFASVSNAFIEDGGSGWIDIKSCDNEAETLSVEFAFNAVTTNGETVVVSGGSAENICFERMK